MAYDKGYVVSILQDGSPVREIGRKVYLRFGSEYKIRLKNKTPVRAKVRVFIDGRKVSNLGDFILSSNQTMDLERFIDHSLSEGNRFKFVPLSDSRVNDPTDQENGVIKVEFYKEKLFDYNWSINTIQPLKRRISPTDVSGPYWSNDNIYGSTFGNTFVCDTQVVNLCSSSEAGATVEGSQSNQNFILSDDFETEPFPTTITLNLRGIAEERKALSKQKSRFCSKCGKRRTHLGDRYCSRCGQPFNR